ncbi:MAG: hypothetical protein IT452_22765 [Planctomycetia bacterium]|nr:hypothetical protein [Planctomycetia bacterium]
MGARAGWLLAGIIAGAVLAAVLLRAVRHGRELPADAAGATAQGDATAPGGTVDSGALRSELEAARREADGLRSENAALRKKLEEAAAQGGGGGGSPAAGAKSWREIAAKLAKLRERVRGKKWDDWPQECKDLQLEMFATATALSRQLGLPFDEALMSPEGLTRLLVEVLKNSDPPPSPEEASRLEALLASTERPWEEYVSSRGGLSKLEQRLAMMETGQKTMGAVLAGLRPEQAEIAKAYEMFEVHADGGPQTWLDGTRDKVTRELTANWVEALKLDPLQQTAIGPVVDDFITRASEMNQDWWRRKQAGDEVPRDVQWRAQVELMIATQKRLAASARLTEEQAAAMKDWGEVFGLNVWDPPPPPPEK